MGPPAKPPPLPPAAKKPAAPAPVPSADGFMSMEGKLSLADAALALRDEQLEARVVLYKAELATSPELDAITDQVVADLRQMQAAARKSNPPPSSAPSALERGQLEIDLIQNLKGMLQRLFRPGRLASVVERKLAEVSKRFARLFFESELHDKIRGSTTETKTMRFPEQALYHVLSRYEARLAKDLAAFEYESPEVLTQARERLARVVNELRTEFLGRTTPELNELVRMLRDVLRVFFTRELPSMVGELAGDVVKDARLADAATPNAGYKVSAAAFPGFRSAFERRFMQRLVPFAEDEMLTRARESPTPFRAETIRFVADPHIFSDVCELVCDAVYDFLYSDGFLDLPADWRVRLAAE